MPTINKKNDYILYIGLGILGLGIAYFTFRPKVKEKPFIIPPATNLYPESEKIRMAKIDDDYRNMEQYISWDAANIHPTYQEYLKYWYVFF